MGAYIDPAQAAALEEGFAKAGKKMDMGKSCLRFRKPEDLALDAVAKLIAATPPDAFIAMHEEHRPPKKRGRSRAESRS